MVNTVNVLYPKRDGTPFQKEDQGKRGRKTASVVIFYLGLS